MHIPLTIGMYSVRCAAEPIHPYGVKKKKRISPISHHHHHHWVVADVAHKANRDIYNHMYNPIKKAFCDYLHIHIGDVEQDDINELKSCSQLFMHYVRQQLSSALQQQPYSIPQLS